MVAHWSDCARHNAPALPVGCCDCGALRHALIDALHSAVEYMKDAGAHMDDFPVVTAALDDLKREPATRGEATP